MIEHAIEVIDARIARSASIRKRFIGYRSNESVFYRILVVVFCLAVLGASIYYGGTMGEWITGRLPSILIKESTLVAVHIGEKQVQLDSTPMIVRERTLIPLRSIFDALDSTVEWDAEKGVVKGVGVYPDISVTLNSRRVQISSKWAVLDTPPQLIEGRTMVPVNLLYHLPKTRVEWSNRQPGVVAWVLMVSALNLLRLMFIVIAIDALLQLFYLSRVNSRISELERIVKHLTERKSDIARLLQHVLTRLNSGGSFDIHPALNVDLALEKHERQLGNSGPYNNLIADNILFGSFWISLLVCTLLAAIIMGGVIHYGILKRIYFEFPAYSGQVILSMVALASAFWSFAFFTSTDKEIGAKKFIIIFTYTSVTSALMGLAGALMWGIYVAPIGWMSQVLVCAILLVPTLVVGTFMWGLFLITCSYYL